MRKYKIRFFFEHGGDCFWGGDTVTVERYGYPIAPAELPLPPELAEKCSTMAQQWWLATDGEGSFPTKADVAKLLARVRAALGEDFEVVDES